MATLIRCDQCNKVDDKSNSAGVAHSAPLTYPWLRVEHWIFGSVYRADFCSAACLEKRARIWRKDDEANAKRDT